MTEGRSDGEDAQPEQRADADQAGPGGTGEGTVGDGVGLEGGSPEDDEEADHPSDDGDDRPDPQALAMNPENIRSATLDELTCCDRR